MQKLNPATDRASILFYSLMTNIKKLTNQTDGWPY